MYSWVGGLLSGLAEVRAGLLEVVGGPDRRLVELHEPGEVDGRADDDQVAGRGVDGLAQVRHLLVPVAHGGQDVRDVGVLLEGRLDGAHGVGPGVYDLLGPGARGGHVSGAETHLAVGQGRAVLYDQDALALDLGRVGHGDRGLGPQDLGLGVGGADVGLDQHDLVGLGGVHLVDDDQVGHAQVGLAGVVGQLVAGPQGV